MTHDKHQKQCELHNEQELEVQQSVFDDEEKRAAASHSQELAVADQQGTAALNAALAACEVKVLADQQSAQNDIKLAAVAALASTLRGQLLISAVSQTTATDNVKLQVSTEAHASHAAQHRTRYNVLKSCFEDQQQQANDEIHRQTQLINQSMTDADSASRSTHAAASRQEVTDRGAHAKHAADCMEAEQAGHREAMRKQEADILTRTQAAEAKCATAKESRRLSMEHAVAQNHAAKEARGCMKAALVQQEMEQHIHDKEAKIQHAHGLAKGTHDFMDAKDKLHSAHMDALRLTALSHSLKLEEASARNRHETQDIHQQHMRQLEVARKDHCGRVVVQQTSDARLLRDETNRIADMCIAGTETRVKQLTAQVRVFDGTLEDYLSETRQQCTHHGQQIVTQLSKAMSDLHMRALPNHPPLNFLLVGQSVPVAWMGGHQVRDRCSAHSCIYFSNGF